MKINFKYLAYSIVILYVMVMITIHRYPGGYPYDLKISDIANVMIAFTSIVSLALASWTFYSQRKDKQYEQFMQHEGKILLEFRQRLYSSRKSIHFFTHDFLALDKKYGFTPKEPPVLKYEDFVGHFNHLVELNEFYNLNQYIFRKYELEKKIEYIPLLLAAARGMPKKDVTYHWLESPSEGHQTYRAEAMHMQLLFSFNRSVYFHFEADMSNPMEALTAYENEDMVKELERITKATNQAFLDLHFDLDKLTILTDSKIPDSFHSRHEWYIQKIESNKD